MPQRGRGTASNPVNCFYGHHSVVEDDGWYQDVPESVNTEVRIERPKSIIVSHRVLTRTPINPSSNSTGLIAGASSAHYVLLRLPLEVAPLREEWLGVHYPQRAAHVLSLIRQSRGGQLYNSAFGEHMKGEGVFAQLISRRFAAGIKQAGLGPREQDRLDCSQFCLPGRQMTLL